MSLIKPLQLGHITFPVNLIQGPLAGVSCAAFRRLVWQYSQPAFCYTEMISSKTLIHQSSKSLQRFVMKDPQEGPVCFQISGENVADVREATKKVTDFGADLIDLNCGCPVNKIRSKGAGSKLLTDVSKLYQLVCAIKQNTSVPVSIKIRVEGQSQEKFHQDIVKIIQDADIDFLVVHGRHWTEHYETPVRYEQIQYFVESLNIPVIGNGDITCVNSLKKMFATGCAGVMIARAGMGQPWLIQKLSQELQGKNFIPPSLAEMGQIFIEHVRHLSILLKTEKFAILQARKFAKYYARTHEKKSEFCAAMNHCESFQDLERVTKDFFIN